MSGLPKTKVCRGCGRRRPLERFSPDFSPIEQCWSKIKTLLRAAKARTREGLEKALAHAIGQITKSDIRGWFKHCGYRVASA